MIHVAIYIALECTHVVLLSNVVALTKENPIDKYISDIIYLFARLL